MAGGYLPGHRSGFSVARLATQISRQISTKGARFALLLSAVGVLLLVSATASAAGDLVDNDRIAEPDNAGVDALVWPLDYRYSIQGTTAQPEGWFYSDRDCGWPTEVSGRGSPSQVAGAGARVSRTLWIFCDSVGYDLTGQVWPSPFGFPSSTIGIAQPNQTVPTPLSWAVAEPDGSPSFLLNLVTTGTNSVPTSCPAGFAEREWPRGAVTLPDNDPRYETVLIFYQNFCVDFAAFDFTAHSGGVAVATWDAQRPDEPLFALRLNDAWLKPGLLIDERAGQASAALGWGTGNLIEALPNGDHHLYSYMCAGGGDCLVARAVISLDLSAADNATALADTANWSYRAADRWVGFPPAGADGACSPTALDTCGGRPVPLVVADATSGNVNTQPAAEPSIKKVDGRYHLLYSPGFHSDHFVVRSADSPVGPFTGVTIIQLPAGECEAGCRVPIWHPELDVEGAWAFSYYDVDGLNGVVPLDRDIGRIKLGWVPIGETGLRSGSVQPDEVGHKGGNADPQPLVGVGVP